jgi:niacin transporter
MLIMNNTTNKVKIMTTAALLGAVGILIPIISPIKFILEPASFTLASHVPIIIAMFISPAVAAFVSLAASIGFLIYGFPTVVVFRALTHIVFAVVGAFILKKNGNILNSYKTAIPFVLLISIIHAVCEVIVSTIFYFNGQSSNGFLTMIIGLVGVGTLIHSSIDFIIAVLVWVPLQKVVSLPVSTKIKLGVAKNI